MRTMGNHARQLLHAPRGAQRPSILGLGIKVGNSYSASHKGALWGQSCPLLGESPCKLIQPPTPPCLRRWTPMSRRAVSGRTQMPNGNTPSSTLGSRSGSRCHESKTHQPHLEHPRNPCVVNRKRHAPPALRAPYVSSAIGTSASTACCACWATLHLAEPWERLSPAIGEAT